MCWLGYDDDVYGQTSVNKLPHTHVTDTHDVGCLRIVGNAIAIPGMLYSEGCIDVSYWSQKT